MSFNSSNVINLIFNEIFNEKIYDFITENKTPIIIDCGANIGFSIDFFKNKYPNCEIYAFEPNDIYYDELKKNIGLFTDVHTYKKAVSDKDGEDIFYLSNERNEFNIPVTSLIPNEYADIPVSVETINFGLFIKQFEVIDFCKVDIEGGESLMLKSLVENNVIHKIKEFVIEYHHWAKQFYAFDELVAVFESNNFEGEIIKSDPPKEKWSISGNTIIRFKNKLYL